MPLLLAFLSAAGLVTALLGDDVWDMLSWLALGALLLVVAWHLARPVFGRIRQVLQHER